MDDKETLVGSCDPLVEAVEIIEKLLALCARHDLKREAYSIALGEELPQPPKRKPGAPQKKVPPLIIVCSRFYWRIKPANVRKGAAIGQPWLARSLRAEAEPLKGSPVLTREEKRSAGKRALQIQNDLSKLTPGQIVIAAYCVRRYNAGETRKRSKRRLTRRWMATSEAERKIFETVLDVLGPLLIKS